MASHERAVVGGWDLYNLVTGARQPESGGLRTENQENPSHSRGQKDSQLRDHVCVLCSGEERSSSLGSVLPCLQPEFKVRF